MRQVRKNREFFPKLKGRLLAVNFGELGIFELRLTAVFLGQGLGLVRPFITGAILWDIRH